MATDKMRELSVDETESVSGGTWYQYNGEITQIPPPNTGAGGGGGTANRHPPLQS